MFKKALFSIGQIKDAISSLRAEHAAVSNEISQLEDYLNQIPLLPVPLADFKKSILEMVDKRGADYLETKVRHAIESYALNYFGHTNSPRNRTIGFDAIDLTITNSAINCPQLMTRGELNDVAFFAFFGDAIKAKLSEVMDKMSAEDFGYKKLSSSEIGTDCAARREEIQTTQNKLSKLYKRKEELEDNLRQLNVTAN